MDGDNSRKTGRLSEILQETGGLRQDVGTVQHVNWRTGYTVRSSAIKKKREKLEHLVFLAHREAESEDAVTGAAAVIQVDAEGQQLKTAPFHSERNPV